MALVGMGCGPVLMGSMLYFAQNFPPGRFAQLCALIIGLGSLGGIAGSTPLALSAQAYGWRATILATGGLTLLAAALVFLVVRDASQAAPAKATQHSLLRAIAEQKGLCLLMPLTLVSYAVVIAERSLWIGPYFDKVHHLVLLERGNAVLAMAIAMALGALAYGPVERWCGGPKVPVVAGSLITATAFIALGLWPAPSVGVAVALLCVAGFAGLTYGTLMAHARLFFPPHLTGRGITFMNFLFIGGAGLGQTVSGPLVQYFGQSAGGGHIPDAGTAFSALHLAFGGALVLASLVYVMAPARRSIPAQKQPEAAQSGHPRG